MKLGRFDVEKCERVDVGVDEAASSFGKRHLLVILLFLLNTISSSTRFNLSVGIEAMTNNSINENPDIPTYDWDNRRVILTSFYWGFGVLQIVGAQMGRVYGIKWLLVVAMGIDSIACLLTPPVAEQFGATGVIMCRMVQGLAQGFFFPYIFALIGQWIPPKERLKSCVLVLSGTPFSHIITILLTTYISSSTSVGWPASFYLFGILGFLWIIPWTFLGYNSPAEHRGISVNEKQYIESSLGVDENTKFVKTPWKEIFTSLPVWATVIAYLGQTWGNIIIQTEIPNYITGIMKLDVASNSLLCSAPYVATFLMAFVFCYIANYLIVNKYVTKLFARKLFTTIGMAVPAAVVIALGFLPEDAQYWSFSLLLLAAGSSSAMYSGHSANVFDMSPTFPGIIKGVANSVSNIFNILPPFTVEIIVTDENDQNYWRTIFVISTTFYISTNIFYFFFASGDLETWDPTCKKINKDNPEK
ncbi:hypothetical protein NQ315_001831 [Exocentrus adspersus]|uniref:Major facilitator superfamily (MFS) profile domain-containing protein n=1 Tax=Exocentrus adspersus TaxID=1586481 RepID=A0AAV8W9K8_9CUCU|nr:hypothetical protein NQ315_001831 [Exocentrus adspersus]